MTQQVLILATNGFEQSELTGPRDNLEQAGIRTTVTSPESGSIKGWDNTDWGDSVTVDKPLSEAKVEDYDALVLPGGQINPDILRIDEDAIALIKGFADAGKPIAAICHAPWLLVEADLVRGRTVTSWPSVRTDLRNAGANVVDQEVAVDGGLITSRNPDDIPAFSKALISELAKVREAEPA
ncbi:type 1 glutamine amidotransferase domain-containing protein [Croceicoccus mobilis]|uniref:Glutamine amidotransferase n=1 Tax=Croceicoccus mobilis TaxID=1703339 RepID=A0A917DW96_9SPHN|nr:type 1 glutamine amidotransferase domain-containing protein [Croceicoccus mobilis]GGD73700.1 glutamine amidotransferase [Croceicoccus mobilis]